MMFMQMAEAAARRSTCYRMSVGAILVDQNNVIGIGYNGPPAGQEHCTGVTCPGNSGCTRAVHAEVNALHRSSISPASFHHDYSFRKIYVTASPCLACAQELVDYGVMNVFFTNEYRIKDGIDYLIESGHKVFRMTPGGYIINYRTGELVDGEET